MSNILIAVDHRENARLLKDHLDHYYSIASPKSEDEFNIPFDLGIFDGHALNTFWSQIQLRKQIEQPLFLPILLITPRQDINMITRQLWRSVDDIIFAPIEKTELFVRIEVLLRARQLSLELQAKNIRLQNEIVSHQETEQSLRESEDRFRAALKNSPVVVASTDRDLRYNWIYNQPAFQASDMLGKCDDEIMGLENTDSLMDFKTTVLKTGVGERREIEIKIMGVHTVFDATIEPIIEGYEIVGLRTAIIDITKKKQAEHRILKLYELVLELSKSPTLEHVAKSIIEYGIAALGARAGIVMLLNHETLGVIQSIGFTEDIATTWQNSSLNLSTASLTVAINTKTPLLHGTVEEQLASLPFTPQMPLDEPHNAAASLPFIIEGSVIGGLGLIFPVSKTFDAEERGFMLTLAHQCAQALERVQLSRHLQEAAVLAERHRLARDLHDAVSQALFAAMAIAESVPQMWEKKPERARELLKQVTSLNRGALAEMRTLLFELRPEALTKTNLKTLLIQLLEAIKARKTIETLLTVTGEPITLLENGHLTFYRIAQESLNNIVKHSQATQVHMILNYTPQQVTLKVIDNGQGFDITQNTGGLGLGGMYERAEAAQLKLRIQSTQGEGTCVELNWIVSA